MSLARCHPPARCCQGGGGAAPSWLGPGPRPGCPTKTYCDAFKERPAGRCPPAAGSTASFTACPRWPRRRPEPRGSGGGSFRGRRGAALAAAMDIDEPDFAGARTAAAGGKAGSRGRSSAGDGRRAAAAAAAAADIEQLIGMGFSRRQARDALEECSHDVAAAVDWLVANCMQ